MTATLLRAAPPPRQHDGWWEKAACTGMDTNMWLTPDTKAFTTANKNAVLICNRCPVRIDCLDEAIEQREVGVIRGAERMPASTPGWGTKMTARTKGLLAAYRRRKAAA